MDMLMLVATLTVGVGGAVLAARMSLAAFLGLIGSPKAR